MKKFSIILSALTLIFLMTGMASAASYSYNDFLAENYTIDISGTGKPSHWVNLGFPNNTTLGGTYTNGVFEYSDPIYQVDTLTIKLTGLANSSTDDSNIDMWLSFRNGTHPDAFSIVSYRVLQTSGQFTLLADIVAGKLFYNSGSSPVADLSNVGTETFKSYGTVSDIDQLWVGYACNFTLKQTDVDVTVHDNNGKVPEPATMILLGSGLLGIVGFRRKFKK